MFYLLGKGSKSSKNGLQKKDNLNESYSLCEIHIVKFLSDELLPAVGLCAGAGASEPELTLRSLGQLNGTIS